MKTPTSILAFVILAIAIVVPPTHAQKIELTIETGHFGDVFRLDFSRDGSLLLSEGGGGTKLWSVELGKQLRSLPDGPTRLFALVFSLESKIIAGTEERSGRVILRSLLDQTEIQTLESDSVVRSIALSTDGRTIATTHTDRTVRLWDVSTHMQLRRLPQFSSGISEVYFTPDGRSLITLDEDENIRIWETSQYANTLSLKPENSLMLRHPILISPDGKRLAGISGSGRRVYLWDLSSGKELPSLPLEHNEWSYPFIFSNDGKTIISGNDEGIVFRDITTGKRGRTLKIGGHVKALALSSSDMLASGNDAGLIRVWDLKSEGKYSDFIGHTGFIQGARFSPDGRTLGASVGDRPRKFFDAVSGNKFFRPKLKDEFEAIAISPDRNLYVGKSGLVMKLFDFAGKELYALADDGNTRSFVFSPDGKLLAGGAYVSDLEGGGEVRLWDVTTGRKLNSLRGGLGGIVPFVQVAFSPDGKILAASAEFSFRLWNVETGRELFTVLQGSGPDSLSEGYNSGPTSLAFSPDSKKLATSHLRDEVIIWDVLTGKKIHTHELKTFDVSSAFFSPAGRLLASGSHEALIKIWDVVADKELASLSFLDDIDWAIVTPEGRFDDSPNGMKLMHYVYGLEAIDLQQLKERYYEPGLLAKLLSFNAEPPRAVVAFYSVELFPSVEVKSFVEDSGKLSIKLVNRGGGIGRVQIFVNDKEFIADARPKGFDPNSEQTSLNLDLQGAPVVAGEPNRLKIVTYNHEGYLSSRGTFVDWKPPGATPSGAPELYAIVAGISDYSSPQLKLHYAAKDASDMAKALEIGAKALFGTNHVHVKLLSSDKSNPFAILPTKTNFSKAFEEFRDAKPTDILVVYLSGHGISLATSDTYLYLTQEARSKESSVLSDPAVRKLTSISSDELVEWIKKIPALKQMMILDTCAAGSAALRLVEKRGITGDQIRAIERLKDRTGFHVLMGSAADSVSYETTQYGQGILTYILLQGMRGAALRDDQIVDVQKLFQYAADEVPQIAKNIGGVQRPIVAAPSATSFDVGMLSREDQSRIPLSMIKPLVLRPRVTLQELGDDTLGLMRELRQRFRDASYFSEADKNPPKFVYVDEDEAPGAMRLVGTYTVNGDVVSVKLFLRKDDQTIRSLPAIEGRTSTVPSLANRIFDLFMKSIDSGASR